MKPTAIHQQHRLFGGSKSYPGNWQTSVCVYSVIILACFPAVNLEEKPRSRLSHAEGFPLGVIKQIKTFAPVQLGTEDPWLVGNDQLVIILPFG